MQWLAWRPTAISLRATHGARSAPMRLLGVSRTDRLQISAISPAMRVDRIEFENRTCRAGAYSWAAISGARNSQWGFGILAPS